MGALGSGRQHAGRNNKVMAQLEACHVHAERAQLAACHTNAEMARLGARYTNAEIDSVLLACCQEQRADGKAQV